MSMIIEKASALHGTVSIPGDKSISHRAVMFSSIAEGTTHISNFLTGADCLSTISCFRRLGVYITQEGSDVTVTGRGMHGLVPEESPVLLDTGNSGTTTRILSGILSPQPFVSVLSGDESVNRRPMKRIMEPLSLMGARIRSINGNGCAPLEITGGPLHGITYHAKVASAQVKSAVLLAGLYADGSTTFTEPAKSRDHTERMLTAFGAKVVSGEGNAVTVTPAEDLYGADVVVPGDISSAAYFIAAGLLVPGSEVLLKNVGINPTREGILRVARTMGGDVEEVNVVNAPEPYCDLIVRSSSLHGTVIEGDLIPTLIDELPVIAVMAAMAEGTTVIRDAAELKVKESNRIDTMTEGLRAMGCDITPTDDGMIISGGKPLHGAKIRTFEDHRVAMSFAIAGLVADGETVLDDERCVRISYPAFFEDLQSLER